MLTELSPQRRGFFLGIGSLVLAASAAVAIGVMAHRPTPVTPASQDAQPPVLLVPGYGGGTSALEVLARSLRSSGRTAEIADLGGDGTGDLRDQATALDRAVRQVLDRTESPSVDLIGYSAGGLVVRLWVTDHAGGTLVRRIVLLGSPQHGTEAAGVGSDLTPDSCPVACLQLSPNSDLIRSLNKGDETPTGPKWVSLWTEQDQTVVPPDSGSLQGAVNFSLQSVCSGLQVTHGDLPSNNVVIRIVMAELLRAQPAVPDSSICT